MTPALFVDFGFEALRRSRLGIIVARIALWTRHSCAAAGAGARPRTVYPGGLHRPTRNPHKRSTSWGLLPCRAFLSLDQPHHPAPLCPIKRMYDVVPISHVAARSKRRATKRSIAFSVAEARPFHTMEFSQCWAGFSVRDQRMLEIWTNW